MAALMLQPYITIFDRQKNLTPTDNRKLFAQKIQDTEKYTVQYVENFLQADSNLTKTQFALAMGSTIFMLYAAYKGCCDVDWEKLFQMSPSDYCEYINAGYERVARKFPKVLDDYNKKAEQGRRHESNGKGQEQ